MTLASASVTQPHRPHAAVPLLCWLLWCGQGLRSDEKVVRELLEAADTNGDGRLDFGEFSRLIRSRQQAAGK